jgi:hypothetical protein
MKRMAALLGALVLTLVMAAPAAATKPEVWYSEAYADSPEMIADCGAFQAMYRSEGWHEETLYFTGKTVKTIYRNRGTDSLYNSVDTSIMVSGTHSFQCHVTVVKEDPLTYFRDCSGTYLNVRAPGWGTIAHLAGHSEEFVVGEPGAPGVELKNVGSEHFDDLCEVLAD